MVSILLHLAGYVPFVLQILDGETVVFQVPGSVDVSIDEPGRYYLWNNYRTVFEGRSYCFTEELPNGLVFSLSEESSGGTVPMQPNSSISSESGSQKKSSIGYFDVTQAGQYKLDVSGDAQEHIFSFEKSLFQNACVWVGAIIAGSLLALAAALGALALFVLGIIDLARGSKAVTKPVQATSQ